MNYLSGQRHPGKLRIFRPAYAKLRVIIVHVLPQYLYGFLPVIFIDVFRVDKAAFLPGALPFSAHGFMVYNIQHMVLQIIGKKDILRGL